MGDGEKWMPDLDSALPPTLKYDYGMQKISGLLNSVIKELIRINIFVQFLH